MDDLSLHLMTPDIVSLSVTEAIGEIQLTADLLLLGTSKRPQVLGPVNSIHIPYTKCRDDVIANGRSLAISIKLITEHIRKTSAPRSEREKIIGDITTSIIRIIESSAHAAYYVAIENDGTKAEIGSIDMYRIKKAKHSLERHISLCKTTIDNTDSYRQRIVGNVSYAIAENIPAFTRACVRAADIPNVTRLEQEQFKNFSDSLQATSKIFITSLKTMTNEIQTLMSIQCSKPMMTIIDTFIEFCYDRGEKFLGKPAILSTKGQDKQLKILGTSMSVVSSCIKFLGIISNFVSTETEDQSIVWNQLSRCQNAMDDGTTQLSQILKEHQPKIDKTKLKKVTINSFDIGDDDIVL